MTSALPDTPGSSPGRQKNGPRERNAFSLNGHDSSGEGEGEGSPHSAGGYDRPDQTVFDLTMDYSDEETLLDWEQYAGMRKFRCWGMDCSLVARFCPFMPWVPPEWYYRYSRRQRRLMKLGFAIFGVLVLLLIGATILVSLLPKQTAPSGLGLANEECTWSSYHLPTTVKPTQYDLEMSVDLSAPFLVTGMVQIHANITRSSKCLVLHAVDMNISHMNRLNPHTHGSWKFNDQEQLILEFEEAIRPPAIDFVLHFNYTLRPGLSGFYRSTYTGASGESRNLATTQMEANSARKAFPCFDEPHLKAAWNFSMEAPSQEKVLFNTPQASATPVGTQRTRHAFATTPPMSSYLVAFIVGDFKSVSTTVPYPQGTRSDRQVSVWGTPARAQQLETALQIATQVLPAYEHMFGVAYPLPKLDLVAIPDFAAGAMENWGLITYRETDLLYSVNDSSIANERRIALVIAHEMAHMWFGDLVTMRDWGELWLNEGFATYFENVGASIARPNFAFFDTFYADFGTSAMATDAKPKSTHALATPKGMDTAEKVEGMFDDISYDKGGSVLRMLRAYLNRNANPRPLLRRSLLQTSLPPINPEENFLRALRNYLQKHSYNNTSSNELWAEMDAVTGEDVTGWMKSWTFQPGFPRVQILFGGPLNNDIMVYQAPFEVSGVRRCDDSAKGAKSNDAPWWIPVSSITRTSQMPSWRTFNGCIMDGPIYTLKDDSDWIKLNAGQFGLYRVNYPIKLWNNLAAASALPPPSNTAPVVSAVDLAGLLDDSWALAQADETPITHFLQLVRSLAKRRAPEYAPWSVASGPVIDIGRLLKLHKPDPACAARWTAFVRTNVTSMFLTSRTELALNATAPANPDAQPDVQARMLRPLLLALAAEFEDANVTNEALGLFSSSNGRRQKVDKDIRGLVYSIVVRSGQQSSYDAIKQLYMNASDASEKARALTALAYAPRSELRNATLEFSISADVRSQDTTSLISQVAGRGGDSLQAAWDFVRTRYNDISEKLGGIDEAANKMGKLLRGVASNLASDEAIREIDAIFEAHKNVLTEPRMQEAAKESVRANLDWLRRNGGPVCEWLSHQ